MKRVFFTLLLALSIFRLMSNPYIIVVISEVYFDHNNNDNWYIELYFDPEYEWVFSDNLDGGFLTSSTDTAYFEAGIDINFGEPMIIAQGSMQSIFYINPEGDHVLINLPNDYYQDYISFGNNSVKAPYPDQSIARAAIWIGWYEYITCKESPQTLGSYPFNVQANGVVEGYIYDLLNHPVPDVEVRFGYYIHCFTDVNGYFDQPYMYCCTWYPHLYIEGNYISGFSVDVEPDSTSHVEVYLDTVLTAIQTIRPGNEFATVYNYPNPVSSYTVFKCSVPQSLNFSKGCINIYQQNGQLVDRILLEGTPCRDNQIYWEAPALDNGMYLYSLELDGKITATNKMTVLR